MDNRIKELGKDQRIALARIVYDLIVADKIIDDDEIVKFEQLFGTDGNRELFRHAQELSFAKAIKLLAQPYDDVYESLAVKKIHREERIKIAEKVANILDETADSDGFCAPSEAVLLSAIDYYLRKNNESYTEYDIQSFRLTDVFIGKRFILYAETNPSSINIEIEENYDLIVNLLASIGFQFIYIPKIVEQYKRKGLKMFKSMSMYIFPDIAEDKVQIVYDKIMEINTKKFIKDYLNDKLGFDIVCPHPSFLVMLGRSSVIGKEISDKGLAFETYANFLKINLDSQKPVLNVINDFVISFNRFVSFNFHIDFNPSKEKILYHGIHKAFFRLVALAKDSSTRYRIDVITNLGKVFINDHCLDLQPGFTAIYIMVLCRSIFGDKKGLPMRKVFQTLSEDEKDLLEKQYQWVISQICKKGKKERKPLYPTVQNRMTEIRQSISNIVGNRLIGEIQLGTGDYIKTLVVPDWIKVDSIEIGKHPDWVQIFNR